jgi:hypothetical protein
MKTSIFWDVTPCSPASLEGFLIGLLFDHEDRGEMFLRNISRLLPDYTALYPRSFNPSLLWKSQIQEVVNGLATLAISSSPLQIHKLVSLRIWRIGLVFVRPFVDWPTVAKPAAFSFLRPVWSFGLAHPCLFSKKTCTKGCSVVGGENF